MEEISFPGPGPMESGFNFYSVIILVMTLLVPIIVMPFVIENAFNSPKSLVMVVGGSLMIWVYCLFFLNGSTVLRAKTFTHKIVLLLIIINLFSFLYTKNPYYTRIAATLNTSCLLLFYFVSLYIDERRAFILIITSALSGLIVSLIVWLQFFDIYILFKGASTGPMIIGTLGNSNYLGAYLIFPLWIGAGLLFLMKGKYRFVPGGLLFFFSWALIFTRARSSWIGFILVLPLFIYFLRRITHSVWLRFSRIIIYLISAVLFITLIWHFAPDRYKHDRVAFSKVFDISSLSYRLSGYIPPSIELWKQSPLFGTGLWSYRNMVYGAQARINERTGDFFNDYPDPRPRRVHNEYLEILNDGGLVAAVSLLLFLVVVLVHGWDIIKRDEIEIRDRVVTAACFCSIISIMLTALFFFPFRVNSTMFMTALIMGVIEGLYLRSRGLISGVKGRGSGVGRMIVVLLFLLMIGLIWYTCIRPFRGEMEHMRYKVSLARGDIEGAERHLLKAIDYDPHNSAYLLYASRLYFNPLRDYGKADEFVERAIGDFDGDVTLWSAYFIKGLIKFRTGSLIEARSAFERSLYFNTGFEPARLELTKVNKIIEEHGSITIRFNKKNTERSNN